MAKSFALQVLLPALVISAVIAGIFLAYRTAPVILEVVDAETGAPVPAARLYLPAGQVQITGRDGRILTRLPRRDNKLAVEAGGYISNQFICSPSRFQWGTYHCIVQAVPQRLVIHLTDALEPTCAVPPARVRANGRDAAHVAGAQYGIVRVERPAQLTIEAPGYLRWEGAVTEPAYFTGQRALEVALQPVRIAGRVIAADSGEALAGARIWAGDYSSLSDAAGAFELLRVPAPFQLRVERAGYMPYRGPLIEEPWLEQPNSLEISLQPTWTAGIVRDADTHLPIVGAVVQTSLQHVESDTSGAFRLRALEAGAVIRISAKDYFSTTLAYAGQETLDIALRQIKVPVTVRDALSGRPIAGALIQAAGRMYLTDETGDVTIIGLLPGQELEASAPHYASVRLEYAGGVPPAVWLAPQKVILQVVDSDPGEPIPGVRLKSGGKVIPS
ncbi:MAG: carboxypeptidase-like regulatory domain-containing protein, partial [Anaerolineae bacterium]